MSGRRGELDGAWSLDCCHSGARGGYSTFCSGGERSGVQCALMYTYCIHVCVCVNAPTVPSIQCSFRDMRSLHSVAAPLASVFFSPLCASKPARDQRTEKTSPLSCLE